MEPAEKNNRRLTRPFEAGGVYNIINFRTTTGCPVFISLLAHGTYYRCSDTCLLCCPSVVLICRVVLTLFAFRVDAYVFDVAEPKLYVHLYSACLIRPTCVIQQKAAGIRCNSFIQLWRTPVSIDLVKLSKTDLKKKKQKKEKEKKTLLRDCCFTC